MNSRPASALLQQVEESIRRRGLLRDQQRLLVAVSGGLDSVVLLHLLHGLATAHRWKLVVAHFNHQLRGAASAADERFVRALARKLHLPFVTDRWAKTDPSRAREGGLEMAARHARHAFLARAASRSRCPTLALAHHADDQIELFYLRLLRGAGGAGLRGMNWSGPAWAGNGLTLVRPLLDRTRDELAAYARAQRIRHREDASNLDLDRDRNWIRHELLPRLARRFGNQPVTGVRRSMEVVGAEAEFVQRAADQWLASSAGTTFSRLHPAVQRQVLRRQLQDLGAAADFDQIERLRLFPGEPVTLAGGQPWMRTAEGRVARRAAGPGRFAANESVLQLKRAGTRTFDGVTIRWRRSPSGASRPPRGRAGRESFDAAKVGAFVRLRHWRPGDRFQPSGLSRATKLQNLFTNLKIPAERRRALLVAETAAGDIFWVEGVRIGEQFKLGPRTRQTLQWHWRRKAAPSPVRPGEGLIPGPGPPMGGRWDGRIG